MNNLNWEVFVTPGIPIVTRDRPAGVQETFFQAMASTLIYGIEDAVVVDLYDDQAGPCFGKIGSLPKAKI